MKRPANRQHRHSGARRPPLPRTGPRSRKAPGPMPRNIYRRAETAAGSEMICGIKARCGVCQYVNLDYAASLKEKHQAGLSLLEKAGVMGGARVLPPTVAPKPLEYRSLFKLAVRPAKPNPADRLGEGEPPRRFSIGLFAQGSHDVVEVDQCPLHVPALKRFLEDLRVELDLSPITPYDEATHGGQLRYVTARAAHLTGELLVTFVVTEPLKAELRRVVDALKRRGHKINSAHMNLNMEPGNAIFGPETIRVAGADRLRERILDLDFEIGPTSFFQMNPWQAINLYRRIEQVAGPSAKDAVAWDLYCGLGQISLVLARLGYRVIGIEENPEATNAASDNARKNRLENRAEFVSGRVEDVIARVPAWAASPSLIVVNPARRGLAESTRAELARLLSAQPESRFLYVSCEAETLARDLADLVRATGFHLRQIEAFDMFAQTGGMEWLAVLTR